MDIITLISTITLTTLLLFIDVCFYTVLQQSTVHTLLACYILYIPRPNTTPILSILAIALSIESVLTQGIFGLNLLYLIPITIIGKTIARATNAQTALYCLLVTACITAQLHLIDPFLLHKSSPSLLYTSKSIAVTLLVVLLLSLKFQNGKLGNRL